MNTQCTAIVLERGGRWKAEKNEGFFPRSYSIYHPQRRIPNVGPGMKRVPGIPGFSFSKLYRPIRFSCYTLIGQKHEKARASAFFVKFVMVQSAWQVGNIVSFFFFQWHVRWFELINRLSKKEICTRILKHVFFLYVS